MDDLPDLGRAPFDAHGPRALSRIAFRAAATRTAQDGIERLTRLYGDVPLPEADVIVCLGGDGFMLEILHETMTSGLPVYGMNCGTVGFLMNGFADDDLPARLANTQAATLHPLRMHAVTSAGVVEEALALNDVFLFRQTRQAAKIRITIDGKVRLPELVCDGVLVAPPPAATAYTLAAHGPRGPRAANLLPLTPIRANGPRRGRGALLPSSVDVNFEVLEAEKRPVAAVADFTEVRDVVSVGVSEDRSVAITLLFDPALNLSERIIVEQFTA